MRIGNAADELAVAIEDHCQRDTLPVSIDAKKLMCFAVRIEQRRIRNPVLRNERADCGRRLVVYPKHSDAFAVPAAMDFLDCRQRIAAWRAPRGPKIDEHYLAFHIAKTKRGPVDARQREIGEV